MSEFDLIPRERPAATSVFYLLLTTLLGFWVVGALLGFFLAIPFIDGSLLDFQSKLSQPNLHPEIKVALFIIEGSATFFGLIVGPLLYWTAVEKKQAIDFVKGPSVSLLSLVLSGLVVFAFSMPNSRIIDWNSGVHLPESLKAVEDWARKLENSGEVLTKFLTTFNSTGDFIIGLVVIAVLPGIGEELVFRGMLQPQLQRWTKNPHAAIWISAFLFSAMHLEFFGFFPRLFLGALFGYLYYWSGNLLVPVLAHFMNNAFLVVVFYLHQLGKITIDVESAEPASWPAVISGTILTFGFLVYLKTLFERNRHLFDQRSGKI